MAFTCKNKIWLENPADLFCSFSVIPLYGMNLEAQLNSIARLVILVFLILLLLNVPYSVLFLLLSLLFIIILYYIQRNQMEQVNTERYRAPKVAQYVKENNNNGITVNKGHINIDRPTTYRFCDIEVSQKYNDPNYMSANQRLAGPQNPKTHIAPVIVPPIADLSYWKANNLVNHSSINRESQQEAYQSGFQVSNCCGNVNNDYIVPEQSNGIYQQPREDYSYPCQQNTNDYDRIQPGELNTACGYNPNQPQAGLPTNYPVGNCQRDPEYKQYNENLFTQIIEPNVYVRNEVNEPINSNIGISFNQQFEPTTCQTTDNGVMYTEHDPSVIEPVTFNPNMNMDNPTEYNVYDPRHSGYGTSYRSYTDQQLGQTRFMYDDVNAIRMPNYITRSNIDHQPYADQYGPLPAGGEFGNEFNSKIRSLANDSFTRATIQQRTELQQRLMRKRNSEMHQLRQAPIRTGGQWMAGGMSCK
jgi:hypothetical protein